MQVSTVGNFKYNKNKKQKLKQKLTRFIAIHLFNRHQVFLNFQ